jgi:hypothetical protein
MLTDSILLYSYLIFCFHLSLRLRKVAQPMAGAIPKPGEVKLLRATLKHREIDSVHDYLSHPVLCMTILKCVVCISSEVSKWDDPRAHASN